MYRRICTESELTAACGSERQSSPSTNCTKICTVRTPTQCFDEETVCPPALVHVPPPADCNFCGDGVYSCDRNYSFDTEPKWKHCVCDPDVAVGSGTMTVFNELPYCKVQGLIMSACTDAESYLFCGIEGARGCTKRTYYVNSAVADAWSRYSNSGDAYTGRHPSELMQYFTQTTNANGLYMHLLKTNTSGNVTIQIPECLCMVDGNTTGMKSILPSDTQLTWAASRFNGTQRFVYGTCGFLVSFVNATWRTDYCPATRGGTCNGHGSCVATARCGAVAARTAFINQLVNFTLNGSSTAFPAQLWLGRSHFILDLWQDWPTCASSGNTGCPPVGREPVVGYPESVAFLASWRSGRSTSSIDYWRYLMLPTTPAECLKSIQEQLCFSGASTSGGCPALSMPYYTPNATGIGWSTVYDPYNNLDVATITLGGSSWANMNPPVVTCWSTFAHEIGGMPSYSNLQNGQGVYGSNIYKPRYATGDYCSATTGTPFSASTRWNPMCACDPGWSGYACEFANGTRTMQGVVDVSSGCGAHGTFFGDTCVCDDGWYSRPNAPCSTQACPSGRFGVDCMGTRYVTGGYFTGTLGTTPVSVPTCVNGATAANGTNIYCVCDEGWVGPTCAIPACPVTSGLVCAGNSKCRRQNDGSHSCVLPTVAGTAIGQSGCTQQLQVCRLANGTITDAGGCACQIPDRYAACRNPASPTEICTNVHTDINLFADGQRCDRCASTIDPGSGVETYRCNCPPYYSGTYCEIWPCKRVQTDNLCTGHGLCNGNVCACAGAPGAKIQTSAGGLFSGTFCEVDVTAQCGTPAPGAPSEYITCTGRGDCVLANGTWACNCAGGYTSASKCSVLATAAPTPAPTAAPANAPTPPPTPAPTPANGTTVTGCNVSCIGGSCVYVNGAPTCVCTEPRVRTFDAATGDCSRNACPNGTVPNANNTACTCTGVGLVNDPPLFGPCRAPLTCPFVGGHICGQRSLIENTTAPIFESTAAKTCSDGTCVCSQMYVAANGTCVERCFAERTVAWNGSCVCTAGFDSTSGCTSVSCTNGRRVNPSNPNECICKETVTGAACNVSLCVNGTLQSNYTCACSNGMFSGTLCDTVACQGTLVYSSGTYSCTCPIGGGWGGALCATNVCLNSGTPDALGYCSCITNATLNRPLCNPSAGCAANSQSVGGVCTCERSWTGAQCRERVCLNGGFFVNATYCICASGWTGQRCNVSTALVPTATPTAAPSRVPTLQPTPAPSVQTLEVTPAPSPTPSSAAHFVSLWWVVLAALVCAFVQ